MITTALQSSYCISLYQVLVLSTDFAKLPIVSALRYGDDPGTGSESEDLMVPQKQTQKFKEKSKSDLALTCGDGDQLERDHTEKVQNNDELERLPSKLVSMHRVRWNMNKGSERWLCSGGAAGIVRVQEIQKAFL